MGNILFSSVDLSLFNVILFFLFLKKVGLIFKTGFAFVELGAGHYFVLGAMHSLL